MAIILENALLCDLDPIGVERGSLRLEKGTIAERGESVKKESGDEVVDCGGAVVLPGLVNGHTHLYSALAAGMPAPPKTPKDFYEILKYVWWRLDRAHDDESNEMSACIGALDAARCGTTTLIDHHASPSAIVGSLDRIEEGIKTVGLRAVLCYEVTDRNGRDGRDGGLIENRRYLEKCKGRKDRKFGALIGAHAAFTLEDDSLDELAKMAGDFDSGIHIHVAEDACDVYECRKRYGIELIDRLRERGILRPDSVIGHGIHLDAEAIGKVNEIGLALAHNPRSNMNNAVGYSPIHRYACPIQLGTDGIGGDMLTESKVAWFKSRDGEAGIGPDDVVALLANGARRASKSLGATLGKLQPEAVADAVITDFRPATPLTAENFAGQFIFALGSQHVRSVIADGKWVLRDRKIESCDEPEIRESAVSVSREVWDRMERL